MTATRGDEASAERRPSWPQVLGIVLLAVVISVGVSVWWVQAYLFPKTFEPVVLDPQESRALEAKLEGLDAGKRPADRSGPGGGSQPLRPEPYSEQGASREISLSERELNALLARNTDLAEKLALDLSDDLLSAKLLVPMDPDFPVLGGRIVRVHAGLEMTYRDGRPVVILKGISIMGVPIPSAWLGGLKNVDLVDEFGAQAGFWHGFAAGVESLEVDEGELKIRLRE